MCTPRVERAAGAAFAAAAALFLAARRAAARTGGGEHWDPGGGDPGLDGGGGGDLGPLVDLLAWLVLRHPQVGVPVVLVLVGVAVAWHLRAGGTTTRRAVRKASRDPGRAAASPDPGLARLAGSDPGFDLAAFLAGRARVFGAVQEAWAARDLEPARRWLSDGLYTRLRVQLELIRRSGLRDAVAGVRVLDARVWAVDVGDRFDAVHVRIDAIARDAEIPASTPDAEAARRAEEAEEERFTEVWSFLRRRGAPTRPGRDLTRGQCPDCGAAVEGSAVVRCGHCRGLLNSGVHDWVVAEITQEDAWQPGSAAPVPGEAELRSRDPQSSRQALEDRAALLFWKWLEARVTGRAGGLAKVATDAVRGEVEGEVGDLERRGLRLGAAEVAVGAVDLVSVAAGEGGRDRAWVRVRWSARTGLQAPGSDPRTLPRWPRLEVVVMGRQSGVTTEPDAGLSSAHCRACSGPLGDSDLPSCDWCGAALAAGDQDWVLEGVLPAERASLAFGGVREGTAAGSPAPSFAAAEPTPILPPWLVPELGDRGEARRLLATACALARADGAVDGGEARLLREMAARWGVTRDELDAWLSGPLPDDLPRFAPGAPEAYAVLDALVGAALIDGRVDPREGALLDRASAHLGVPKAAWRHRAGELRASLLARA